MQKSRSSARRTGLIGGLLGLGLLGLLGLAMASILVFPVWLHPPLTGQELAGIRDPEARLAAQDARRQRQDDTRATLLQGVGALLLFSSAGIGAYFTWRQVRNTHEQLKGTREQLEIARRQAENSDRQARDQLAVDREGQVTERFTRAIDQLGSDRLDIRLGGIYALERVARDSEADRPTIAEVLTAYVRTHSPWPPTQPGQYKPDWPLDEQPDLRTRAPDVQAALTVLGRGRFASLTTSRASLNLQATDLRKADLYGAHLEQANLIGTYLWRADLRDAHLERAFLIGAHLEQANLERANLEGALLEQAHLERANLINAHLGAILLGAHLEGADLFGAHLERASLGGAHLEGADLGDAHLEGASLLGAHLERANLEGANLEGAALGSADMEPQRLVGTDLEAVGLGARVEKTWVLGRTYLKRAKADYGTRWPDGFDWQAAGVTGTGIDPNVGSTFTRSEVVDALVREGWRPLGPAPPAAPATPQPQGEPATGEDLDAGGEARPDA
jgi:uncharacterized protein YjbI with pentapeptide repeats